MGQTTIRAARPAEEAAIRDCAEQAYARYIPAIGRKPAPMIADFARHIADGEVYVAVSDAGELQGFIVFRSEANVMFLENVAVRPDASGKGIGKALIAFCEAVGLQTGSTCVRLYTNVHMTENLSIYPRLGYTETGRSTEDGFDRVYFEKSLAQTTRLS